MTNECCKKKPLVLELFKDRLIHAALCYKEQVDFIWGEFTLHRLF